MNNGLIYHQREASPAEQDFSTLNTIELLKVSKYLRERIRQIDRNIERNSKDWDGTTYPINVLPNISALKTTLESLKPHFARERTKDRMASIGMKVVK